jgi:hypothetical protein
MGDFIVSLASLIRGRCGNQWGLVPEPKYTAVGVTEFTGHYWLPVLMEKK